jgi:hypothetical protein
MKILNKKESERNIIMNYIDEMLKGKKVRITYKKFVEDYIEEGSGWKSELWSHDENLKMFVCYYPISSYENGFCTYHTLEDATSNLKDIDMDEMVESVKLENGNNSSDVKSLKELAQKILDSLDEDKLRLFIKDFQ